MAKRMLASSEYIRMKENGYNGPRAQLYTGGGTKNAMDGWLVQEGLYNTAWSGAKTLSAQLKE
jgi:hypothetical protein